MVRLLFYLSAAFFSSFDALADYASLILSTKVRGYYCWTAVFKFNYLSFSVKPRWIGDIMLSLVRALRYGFLVGLTSGVSSIACIFSIRRWLSKMSVVTSSLNMFYSWMLKLTMFVDFCYPVFEMKLSTSSSLSSLPTLIVRLSGYTPEEKPPNRSILWALCPPVDWWRLPSRLFLMVAAFFFANCLAITFSFLRQCSM